MSFRDLPLKRLKNQTKPRANYTSLGDAVEVEVERLDLLQGIELRVACTLGTGATPGTPAAFARNPAGLLQNLRVQIGSAEEINVPADLIHVMGQYVLGSGEPLAFSSFTDAQLADASKSFSAYVTLYIPFAKSRMAAGFDAFGLVIPARNRVYVRWNWGGVAHLMNTPVNHAITPGSTYVDVTLRRKAGAAPATGFGAFLRKVNKHVAIAATTADDVVQLDGGRAYSAIWLSGYEGNGPSDGVFTSGGNLKVAVDGVPVNDELYTQMDADLAARLPAGFPRTGVKLYDPTTRHADQNTLAGCLRVAPSSLVQLTLDETKTAATCAIKVVAEELQHPALATASRGPAT